MRTLTRKPSRHRPQLEFCRNPVDAELVWLQVHSILAAYIHTAASASLEVIYNSRQNCSAKLQWYMLERSLKRRHFPLNWSFGMRF